MKFFVATFLFAVIAVAQSASISDTKCGPNQVYLQCGTACPEHCPAYNKDHELETKPKRCTKQCLIGCACAPGFVRDLRLRNECVKMEECLAPLPPQGLENNCGPNQVFLECGTACPEHCPAYNKNHELETKPKACTKQCVIGCACAPGFVRDLRLRNECVKMEECSAPLPPQNLENKCGPNQVFLECGTACPEHCPAYNKNHELETKPKHCTEQCVSGCACAPGFVRDLRLRNECVKMEKCSAPIPLS